MTTTVSGSGDASPAIEALGESESEQHPALRKLYEVLRAMPKAGEGKGFNDGALPRAVRLAQIAGIPMEETIRLILETQRGAERDDTENIRATAEKFYNAPNGTKSRRKTPDWSHFDEKLAERVVSGAPKTLEELRSLSPEKNLHGRRSSEFLLALFPGSPSLTHGKKVVLAPANEEAAQKPKECYHAETLMLSEATAHHFDGREYVVSSPALRRFGIKQDGHASKHCASMYGPRHYLVLESDHMPKDRWAAVLWHLSQFAPLVMVVDSGGKSLHGWFDCEGVPESQVEVFFDYATRLGADKALWKVMQFVRMPNGTRLGGARQQVVFWHPAAKGQPWNLKDLPGDLVVRSILDVPAEDTAESNLLGDRFLCRGKAILLVGPTGVGKSTLNVQASVQFALGRDLFGLKPEKPLRILIVQAENDAQELREMVYGALSGSKVTPEETARVRENVFYLTMNPAVDWLRRLDPEVSRVSPDLIILDPLFAFFRGNVSEQEKISDFLRGQLQPFLEKHDAGMIVCHHVNKPPNSRKDRPEWQAGDFAYAGSGSVEIANWCKGVLAMRNIGSRDVFELVVGKRHKRAQFRGMDGNVASRIYIRHSPDPGILYWELADEEDAAAPEDREKLANLGKAFRQAAVGDSVSVGELAAFLDMDKRTVNRRFEGGRCVEIPAKDGQRGLRLSRKNGKIFGVELAENGGVVAKVGPPRRTTAGQAGTASRAASTNTPPSPS